jgi:hypothetical protein
VFWFVPRGLQSPLRLRRWVRENEPIPGDIDLILFFPVFQRRGENCSSQ